MKKKSFRQLIREFQDLDRQLSDNDMQRGHMGGEEMGYGDEEMGYGDGEYYDEPEYEAHHEGQEGDSAEEQAMHANEVIKHEPIIGKIRETAIEGLKKYADNPTSSLYEFFKKVFLESDKVLTDTGKKK